MRLRATDRGLAVQVGVTILLGFVVIALATYQVQVVPGQNAEVEFSHSQTVQGELQDVRGAIVSVPGGGNGRSVSVQLGTTYPSRTIFVNPSPPTGQLRTANEGNLTIDNATAVGSEEIDDFWTGDPRNVTTTALEYQPNYNEYRNGPRTVVENTIVYDVQPRSGDVVVDTDQRLVDGDRINLVAVQGDYQEASGQTVTVDVRATSASTRTVTVSGDGDPITITVPTQLDASTWSELLADEPNFVDATNAGTNQVRIELDGSETYELRMAKAGLTNGVDRPGPAYLTDVEGGPTVDEGTNETLVVEVRDEYNNPVSGVPLNVSTARGDTAVTAQSPSDADGRVPLEYQPPANIDGATQADQVNASFSVSATNVSGFQSDAPENVTLDVSVNNADGSGTGSGGGGGAINPASGVVLQSATTQKNNNTVVMELENLDPSNDRNITQFQYTFFSVDGQGNGNSQDPPERIEFASNARTEKYELRGKLKDVNPDVEIKGGESKDLLLEFYAKSNGMSTFDVRQGDFFVITIVFDDGQVVRYFVAPTE